MHKRQQKIKSVTQIKGTQIKGTQTKSINPCSLFPRLHKFIENGLKLFSHKLIINHQRKLPTLFIVLTRWLNHLHMLPLSAHVIVDNHLHVQSVVPFLLESLF
jgi:hypothetical protein